MKKNEFRHIIKLLDQLHTKYPSYTIARNISTALSDYGDFWGMTDKEFSFALEKYMAELELDDSHIVTEEYVKHIQEDAAKLFETQEPLEEEWEE